MHSKKHLGKCLASTNGYFHCGKVGHKMRYCSTISAKTKEANTYSFNVPDLMLERRIISMYFKPKWTKKDIQD